MSAAAAAPSNDGSPSFDLAAYLRRVGLADSAAELIPDDVSTLARMMAAQARSIPFENLSVVVGLTVSMADADVERVLVGSSRGGYCFQLNTLMRLALKALGFTRVEPTLCRVRWNKPEDSMLAPSHMILRVWCSDGVRYLVDVGFAGPGAPVPVSLDTAEPQQLPDGVFRIGPFDRAGCTAALEKQDSEGIWRACYCFDPDVDTVPADLVLCNWGSCTLPGSRFTTQLFAHISLENETHYVRVYVCMHVVTSVRAPDYARGCILMSVAFLAVGCSSSSLTLFLVAGAQRFARNYSPVT